MPLVYVRTPRLASSTCGAKRSDHTCRARLSSRGLPAAGESAHVHWRSRAHFYGIAAQMIRRILVDTPAHRWRQRGAGALKLELDEGMAIHDKRSISSSRRSSGTLAALDERQSRIVELRSSPGFRWKKPRK